MERLQKIIANSGYTSRRKAEDLIRNGKVFVNDKVITEMGYKVKDDEIVRVGETVINRELQHVYYLLNKPRGVISSSSDEHGRKTVTDLIATDSRIYPIGRLDYDTTGIILLTNDGDFANMLMHPKNNVPKTYLAKINGVLDKNAIQKLKSGIKIDNRTVDIIDFKIKTKDIQKNYSLMEITIIEGRNHIIKRIFQELGFLVDKLTRIKYGFLTLDNLPSGKYRKLTIKEIKKFYSITK